jgi:Transglutaminase-like superfamily
MRESLCGPGIGTALIPGPDVYFARYDGEVVVLDARADRYFCAGPKASRAILSALEPANVARPRDVDAALTQLVDGGFLVPAEADTAPRNLTEPRVAGGLAVCAWQPDRSSYLDSKRAVPAWRDVAAAVSHLWRTDCLRRRGMSALLHSLRRQCAARDFAPGARRDPQPRLGALLEAHVMARMIYPRRIECLVGSSALAWHGWRTGMPVRFVIGVQKYPFYAHAWVELGETVVNDIQETRDRLAIIVGIPHSSDLARSRGG